MSAIVKSDRAAIRQVLAILEDEGVIIEDIDIEQNYATINTGEGMTKTITHYQQQGSSAEELLIRRVSSSQASIPHSNQNSTINPTTIQTMPRPVLFRDIVLTQLHMHDESRKQTKQEYPNVAHN